MSDLSKLSSNRVTKFTKAAEEALNAPNRIEQRNPAMTLKSLQRQKQRKPICFTLRYEMDGGLEVS